MSSKIMHLNNAQNYIILFNKLKQYFIGINKYKKNLERNIAIINLLLNNLQNKQINQDKQNNKNIIIAFIGIMKGRNESYADMLTVIRQKYKERNGITKHSSSNRQESERTLPKQPTKIPQYFDRNVQRLKRLQQLERLEKSANINKYGIICSQLTLETRPLAKDLPESMTIQREQETIHRHLNANYSLEKTSLIDRSQNDNRHRRQYTFERAEESIRHTGSSKRLSETKKDRGQGNFKQQDQTSYEFALQKAYQFGKTLGYQLSTELYKPKSIEQDQTLCKQDALTKNSFGKEIGNKITSSYERCETLQNNSKNQGSKTSKRLLLGERGEPKSKQAQISRRAMRNCENNNLKMYNESNSEWGVEKMERIQEKINKILKRNRND